MNPFKQLNKSHPRIWAVVTFPVFIFATVIVLPLEILVNFIPDIWHELREMFGHLRWDWKDCCKEPVYIVKWCWQDWYSIITTGKGIKDEEKNEPSKEDR